MRVYDLIKKKRDGKEITFDEMDYLIENYTNGRIPDYQMSAFLMAIYFKKMNKKETADFTRAMIDSGDRVDLSRIRGIKVDKHSTGGVGDTTTIVLGPMVAACGLPFVKMSGRGLGHTGGTLDKLESIEGFRVELLREEFISIANKIGISICSQTASIAPADKKLYSLRDVTATVENISLISSSIMSKKLAIGSDAIILDVKVGSGAFMKGVDEAIALARNMVDIGTEYGRQTIALVTNMDEPLGNAVGNALEVKEAIEILRGNGSKELFWLCLELGCKLLLLAKRVKDEKEGKELLKDAVYSGRAYNKLIQMVEIQGGNVEQITNPSLLPKARYIMQIESNSEGYIRSLDAEEVGVSALKLGSGRETMDSSIDSAVGIILRKKIDDWVSMGDILAEVHANDLNIGKEVARHLKKLYKVGKRNEKPKQLIYCSIDKDGIHMY